MINIVDIYNNKQIEFIENLITSLNVEVDEHLIEQFIDILSIKDDNYVIKSNILMLLRKHKGMVDRKMLAEALNIDIDIANQLMNRPLNCAYFPIVGLKDAKISKLCIIKLQGGGIVAFRDSYKKQFSVLRQLTDSGFAVLFFDDFVESSFMLAAYVAIMSRREVSNYIFSGRLDELGNILSVKDVDIKQQMADKADKTFIFNDVFNNIDELAYILLNDRFDVPFSIAVMRGRQFNDPKEASYKNLRKLTEKLNKIKGWNFESIKSFFGFQDNDFVFYIEDDFLPDSNWSHYLKKAFKKLKTLKSKFQDKVVVPHFSFMGASSFAFGLGVMHGAKSPFVFYHFDAENKSFEPVLNYREQSIRYLKDVSMDIHYLNCDIDKFLDNEAIVVHLASHQPIGDVKKTANSVIGNCGIAYISLKQKQGNIPLSDWSDFVRELYSLYNRTKESDKIQKRHLFFSCPVPIAFGLGIDIEKAENISVYHYSSNKNGYFRAFDTREL